jgi:hypothetical protein
MIFLEELLDDAVASWYWALKDPGRAAVSTDYPKIRGGISFTNKCKGNGSAESCSSLTRYLRSKIADRCVGAD